MNELFTVGQEVITNDLYFSRYGQVIAGEVVKVERDKIWVKNQYNTISVINNMCLECKVNEEEMVGLLI
ncbi:hypothetical protein P9E76_17915 [Schinkia azotoformans]|uniref:Uncharacterized protein n=1 Tax=Schinkia azotoformans LMG 9581 TaxID=1131731 RepID=K6CJ91_SCHAZ|nr:hypothetical protein [Schinkia azotoformans]EKN71220.1 hypothetical protein BAZO_00335 [Schinkia azotoformans LMG 9581]MEC1638936.1 hypothetical protein [Schinkia azotoformans]MEC1720962.1 hypothetical protein [Schinkia azotoformans]MEC1946901.1 hypothetical protein [Schinkia azotoformans]MED4353086.1 hypothetical protein [Schinkia azotoformans]